jgi:ceramide glucosyltransferase
MTLLSVTLHVVSVLAVVGGIAYALIAMVSAYTLQDERGTHVPVPPWLPAMSLLKPLCGVEPGLEAYLESFFRQEYPAFELLFAVRQPTDPAAAIVARLTARYPDVAAHLVVTGEPPYANAKVYSLEHMAARARHPILVITDSDTSVSPQYLQAMARSFEPEDIGAVTNLYRGVGGTDVWSKLEALGMSTEFMAGVIVAARLEGMTFALGPSMAIRTECLRHIGGFRSLADYFADDFVLGQRVTHTGRRVCLSTHVVNHHATSIGAWKSFQHRLRWNRSTRFSRPVGYIGQGVTYVLPWALVSYVASPHTLNAWLLLGALIVRAGVAWSVAVRVLEDPTTLRHLWLLPLQDVLSFAAWVGGFLGRKVMWRNERYRLLHGGRCSLLTARRSA